MYHRRIEALTGRTALLEGEEWLYFSGTSYLGLNFLLPTKQRIDEGMEKFGIHFGGSRLSNVRFPVYENLENFLANFAGSPTALTVSSGALAGQLILKALKDEGEFIFLPGVHPAFSMDHIPPITKGPNQSNSLLEDISQRKRPMVIFASSVDPVQVESFPLHWLEDWPEEAALTLVIDDSHGFGIRGRNGAGIYNQLNHHDRIELVVMSSLGKAFGMPGAVILCSERIKEKIWRLPLFGGASPMPPAHAYALPLMVEEITTAQYRLSYNQKYLASALQESLNFYSFDEYPVFRLLKSMPFEQYRILLSSFSYPTSASPLITRIVINALHTTDDIDQLIKALRREKLL